MPDRKLDDCSEAHAEAASEKDGDDEEAEFVERDPTGRYGRYNEILGKGAFKTVYRAFDEVDGIEVAWNQVKVEDVLQSPEDLERLYSEVHLLKSLKHKNIIKLYNSWVDTKTKNVNFITEIFTSGTLRQYRKKHKHVDIRAVKNWAKQILRGLLYLHSHNPPIIHRDLKCDNIFVNGNQGEVKIGDLGLAAILRQAHAAHSVIGTPEFMAPELYEEEYNELVDIYSFGMCLLEMVTFEYPYSECTNAAQIYKKVTSGKKPAALDKVRDLEVRAFIEKCLATASKRLPARELLMDPFLQSENDREPLEVVSSISRSTSRADDMEGLGTIKEERPASQEPVGRKVEAGPEGAKEHVEDSISNEPCTPLSTARTEEEQVGSPDSAHSEESDDNEDQRNSSSFSLREEGKRSRDFRVKGKKKDDDTVFLRVRIADHEGHIRNIHFPFSIEGDTAMSVASEMVAELDLSDQDVTTIAEMIDAAIVALVPDWRPGASFEETGVTEADEMQREENLPAAQSPPEVDEEVPAVTGAVISDEDEEAETSASVVIPEMAALPQIKTRSPRTGPLTMPYSPRVEGTSSSMHGRFEEVTYHPEGSDYKHDTPRILSRGSSEGREDGDEWDLSGEVTSPVSPTAEGTFLDVKTEQTPTNLLKIVEHQNVDALGAGCNEVLVTIKSAGGPVVTQDPLEIVDKVIQEALQQEDSDVVTVLSTPGNAANVAEQDESIARELKLLAVRQEQELRELQRKHESALLEIRNRCRCKRSNSLNSPQLSSPPLNRLLESEGDLQQGYDLKVGLEASGVDRNPAAGTGGASSSGFLLQSSMCNPDQGICYFELDSRARPVSPSASCSNNECFADLLQSSKSGDVEVKQHRHRHQMLRPAGTWPECSFGSSQQDTTTTVMTTTTMTASGGETGGGGHVDTLFDGSERFVDATCSEEQDDAAEFSGRGEHFLLGNEQQVVAAAAMQDELSLSKQQQLRPLLLQQKQGKVADPLFVPQQGERLDPLLQQQEPQPQKRTLGPSPSRTSDSVFLQQQGKPLIRDQQPLGKVIPDTLLQQQQGGSLLQQQQQQKRQQLSPLLHQQEQQGKGFISEQVKISVADPAVLQQQLQQQQGRIMSSELEQQRKEQLQKSMAELEARTLQGLNHSRNGYLSSTKKNVGI